MVRSLPLTAGKWVFVPNGGKGSCRSVDLTLGMYLFGLYISSYSAWEGVAKVSLGETAEGLLPWISRYAIGDTPSVEADREGEA